MKMKYHQSTSQRSKCQRTTHPASPRRKTRLKIVCIAAILAVKNRLISSHIQLSAKLVDRRLARIILQNNPKQPQKYKIKFGPQVY